MTKAITFESSAALRVGQLVRLALGSDRDGEILGAVRAINRTLIGAGSDAHHLADVIEEGLKKPPLPPPPKEPPPRATERDDIDDMLRFCMGWLDTLNEYEANFVKRMTFFAQRDGAGFEMSPKQRAFLASLFDRLRGIAA